MPSIVMVGCGGVAQMGATVLRISAQQKTLDPIHDNSTSNIGIREVLLILSRGRFINVLDTAHDVKLVMAVVVPVHIKLDWMDET